MTSDPAVAAFQAFCRSGDPECLGTAVLAVARALPAVLFAASAACGGVLMALAPIAAPRGEVPRWRELVQDHAGPREFAMGARAAESEMPLAGAEVALTVVGGRAPAASARATTDAVGIARASLDIEGAKQVEVRISAPGRLAVVGRFDPRAPIAATAYLWPSALGRIRVRDSRGAAVSGIEVRMSPRVGGDYDLAAPLRARTDREGWTEAVAWPAGPQRARVAGLPLEFATEGELDVDVTVRDGRAEIELPLPDPATLIVGKVVGSDGLAIGEGRIRVLRAGDAATLGPRLFPIAPDGRFVVAPPAGEAGPFRFAIVRREHGEQVADGTFAAGERDAVARVPGPREVYLRVLDARDGTPVEMFRAICFRVHTERGGDITGAHQLSELRRHAEGRLLLPDLAVGEHRVLVVPDDDSLLPSGFLSWQVEPTTTQLTVRLHAPLPLRVLVRDTDGRPLAGSKVRLRAPLSAPASPEFVDYLAFRSRRSYWTGALDLASATTDAAGRATLTWQPWLEPTVLRAETPGHLVEELTLARLEVAAAKPSAPASLVGVDLTGSAREVVAMRIQRGATLRVVAQHFARCGELDVDHYGNRGDDLAALRPALVLRNASDDQQHVAADGQAFAFDSDGEAVCTAVPPGRWQLCLEFWQLTAGGGRMRVCDPTPVAEVVATANQTSEASFDLRKALPGGLRGQVFLDDELVTPAELGFSSLTTDRLGRPVSAGIGIGGPRFLRGAGGYLFAGLRPGLVDVSALIAGKSYHSLAPIAVAPGATRDVDLHFRHLRARIRLQRADGRALAHRLARVADQHHTTDADGWLTIDPVPALRLPIDVYPEGLDRHGLSGLRPDDPRVQRRRAGAIDLDAEVAASEHVLTVADG